MSDPDPYKYHEFMWNPSDVKEFAKLFNIKEKHLAMCIYLTARRKYYPELSDISLIVNRGIVCGGDYFENDFHRTILKLNTPIECYEDEGLPIPTEAFGIYVIINPKDTFKALAASMFRCVDHISKGEEMINAFKAFKVELPKTSLKTDKYKQIDIDTKEVGKISSVNDLFESLQFKPLLSVETRGGFHIVYNCEAENIKQINKSFYEFKQNTLMIKSNPKHKPTKDYWFSVTKEPMIILPGTFQGGFKTRIITIENWLYEQGVGY